MCHAPWRATAAIARALVTRFDRDGSSASAVAGERCTQGFCDEAVMVNDCSAVGCHNRFGWSSLSDKSRSYNEQAPKPHHLQHRYYTLRNVRYSIYECSEHS